MRTAGEELLDEDLKQEWAEAEVLGSGLLAGYPDEPRAKTIRKIDDFRAQAVDEFALVFGRLVDPNVRPLSDPAAVTIARIGRVACDRAGVSRTKQTFSHVALFTPKRQMNWGEALQLRHLPEKARRAMVRAVRVTNLSQTSIGSGTTRSTATKLIRSEDVGVGIILPEYCTEIDIDVLNLNAQAAVLARRILSELTEDAANQGLNPDLGWRPMAASRG